MEFWITKDMHSQVAEMLKSIPFVIHGDDHVLVDEFYEKIPGGS